jgi:hypothetical protein
MSDRKENPELAKGLIIGFIVGSITTLAIAISILG